MVIENENIYTDLEVLPIYNFDKCIKGDLTYLKVNRKEQTTEDLNEIWQKLYNEYCELTYNNETQRHYRLLGEIKWLESRLTVAPLLINLLTKTPPENRKELIKELKYWKLSFSSKKPLKPQIESNINVLNNSKTKLNRKLTELEDLRKYSANIKDNTTSLQKQAIRIHKNLGIQPNIFKDSVVTWLSYYDEIKALADAK